MFDLLPNNQVISTYQFLKALKREGETLHIRYYKEGTKIGKNDILEDFNEQNFNDKVGSFNIAHRSGKSIHFVVQNGGTKQGEIVSITALIQDLDCASYTVLVEVDGVMVEQKIKRTRKETIAHKKIVLEQLNQFIEPSLIVDTKNGYHIYFILMNPDFKNVLKYKEIMLLLCHRFPEYSDFALVDIGHTLRMPNYEHRKDVDDPYLVRVVKYSPEVTYTMDGILNTLNLTVASYKAIKNVEINKKNDKRSETNKAELLLVDAADYETRLELSMLPDAKYAEVKKRPTAMEKAKSNSEAIAKSIARELKKAEKKKALEALVVKPIEEHEDMDDLKLFFQQQNLIHFMGLSVRENQNFKSPFRTDDTPSCAIARDSRGKWRFFDNATKDSMDIFDVVMKREGVKNFMDAIKRLAKHYNYTLKPFVRKTPFYKCQSKKFDENNVFILSDLSVYPNLEKVLSKNLGLLGTFNDIAKKNIRENIIVNLESAFWVSCRFIEEKTCTLDLNKKAIKGTGTRAQQVNRILNQYALLGLITKIDYRDLPEAERAKSIKMSKNRIGDRAVSWYSTNNFAKVAKKAEKIAKMIIDNKLKLEDMKIANIKKVFGEETMLRVYPNYCRANALLENPAPSPTPTPKELSPEIMTNPLSNFRLVEDGEARLDAPFALKYTKLIEKKIEPKIENMELEFKIDTYVEPKIENMKVEFKIDTHVVRFFDAPGSVGGYFIGEEAYFNAQGEETLPF